LAAEQYNEAIKRMDLKGALEIATKSEEDIP
jgi:hypothetical protein